eukprot:COSAG01_NODE_8331_length_2826_cov_1.515952_4_plen_69_part_00
MTPVTGDIGVLLGILAGPNCTLHHFADAISCTLTFASHHTRLVAPVMNVSSEFSPQLPRQRGITHHAL